MLCSIFAAALSIATSNASKLPQFERFALNGVEAPVAYYATKSLETGDPCSVAAVFIHGWGLSPNPDVPEGQGFRQAAYATLGPDAVQPFVVAPIYPRPKTMRRNKIAEDGRAVWNASWEGPLTVRGSQHDDWRGGGDANGTKLSSFDVIDRIFAALGDKARFPNLKRVVLAGFSAGGQFVGRYAAVGKGFVRDGVEVVYMSLSPSTHLRLDRDVAWHYGLKDRPRYSRDLSYEDILSNLSKRRIWYACGELDTLDVKHTSLDSCPEALPQGIHRLDRFNNFRKHVAAFPAWERMSTFVVLRQIGHKCELAYATPEFVRFALGLDNGNAK